MFPCAFDDDVGHGGIISENSRAAIVRLRISPMRRKISLAEILKIHYHSPVFTRFQKKVMFRQIFFILCVCAVSLNAFAQLPNQNGQIWREYPIVVPPENAKPVPEIVPSPFIVEYIRRETGESAWIGNNFGLISCDGRKLYVYHAPAMQQRVAEIAARFMRPETRNVQFATELQFHSFPKGHEGIADIRQPIYKYLNPILKSDGITPVCKTPGVSAYWVAKEDVPKLREALTTLATTLQDRRASILECPKTMTFNGQPGSVSDTTTVPFVTDVTPIQMEGTTGYQPIIRMLEHGQSIQMFSLLSWDCRTVTTDVSAAFSAIKRIDQINVDTAEAPITLQVPQTEKSEFSERGLTWNAEGMLVVFFGGIERQAEYRVEAGKPVLNKIPYMHWLFSNTAISRDTLSVNGILTVQMVADSPQQAVRQGNVVR